MYQHEKEESSVELNSSSGEHDTNSKLLELERNIAKASIISIGMETANRVDKYIERSRYDRRRLLNNLEINKEEETNKEKETNEISFSTYHAQKEQEEGEEEEEEEEEETNEEKTNKEETNEEEINEEETNVISHSNSG